MLRPNRSLFIDLLVSFMSTTPFAVLLELYFARDKLPILARPIIGAPALTARDLDELVL